MFPLVLLLSALATLIFTGTLHAEEEAPATFLAICASPGGEAHQVSVIDQRAKHRRRWRVDIDGERHIRIGVAVVDQHLALLAKVRGDVAPIEPPEIVDQLLGAIDRGRFGEAVRSLQD